MEILLSSPVPQIALNKVRISNITDNPQRKELDFRLSIGYTDPDGSWVEVRDYHEVVANIPGENEAKPAQPKYDNLQSLIKTSGKSAEEIILIRVKTIFPGTIQ